MGPLEQWVKQRAREQGFDLVGIATADPFPYQEEVAIQRLRQGLLDGLLWFTEQRVRLATHPQELLPGARSIITVGASYNQPGPGTMHDGPRGMVARYARGRDYHRILKRRLRAMMRLLEGDLGRGIQSRVFVDDGPMLDRAAAQRAGLGWYGKNTNILTSSHGSWIVLGQVLCDLELEPDAPLRKSCGQCQRCMEACPTGAIVAPYVVDSTRCISYLTIECRGPIPRDLRSRIGAWVFGCDLCQEVCPVNRNARPGGVPTLGEGRVESALQLIPLLKLGEEEFQRRFQGTAVMRAKRAGLQRNACVALGNLGDRSAVLALCEVLSGGETLVRGHAAWALGRLGGAQAIHALEQARISEGDPWVMEEIALALAEVGPGGRIPLSPAPGHGSGYTTR